MKITYPNMGNLGIGVKSILEGLGFSVVTPPPISKKSATIGTKFAPEGACYPFKLVLGNIIEALDKGADTIIMVGGEGPCRFGYFAHLMSEIIKDCGYEAKLIVLEGEGVLEQIDSLRKAAGATWAEVIRSIKLGWIKTLTADYLESSANNVRPLENKNGVVTEILTKGLNKIYIASNIREVKKVKKTVIKEFSAVTEQHRTSNLKVGLVGDIYMLIEPYANCQIEELLGRLGVEVSKSMYISQWVKHHLGTYFSQIHKKGLLRDALPYLQDFVGGHGLDTIANIVRYYRGGYDGIIHILPMTCMPEIVAQSVSSTVSKDQGIPVLTLVLDEHSGIAGLQSRIEAFTDMLLRKKSLAGKKIKSVGQDIYSN